MTFHTLFSQIRSDLYRYIGAFSWSDLLKHLAFEPGFQYTCWMRVCGYLRQYGGARRALYVLARCVLMHYTYKYGIDIPSNTVIGSGLYIGHFGGIVVNCNAVIGKNCNLSHGVTLGEANRGPRQGFPVVGDNVYIGPGAKLVGNVRVGNNVAIGANCVVTRDIPDNAVVAGVPGKVISYQGAAGYINRTDYELATAGR